MVYVPTGSSAKSILHHLSSSKSGESYEHYMFIVLNTLSLNVCLVLEPQQHTHTATLVLRSLIIRFCYYYYYCYDYCYSTTSSMHGLLLTFDHLSLPVICPSVCCHTSDSTTTTTQQQQQQAIADRLVGNIAATVVDSLQATTVSLILARVKCQ